MTPSVPFCSPPEKAWAVSVLLLLEAAQIVKFVAFPGDVEFSRLMYRFPKSFPSAAASFEPVGVTFSTWAVALVIGEVQFDRKARGG